MGTLRLPALRIDLAIAGAGAAATLFATASVGRLGTDLALFLVVGTTAFAAAVLAFLLVPHVAFAGAIAWFAFLEAVRVQVYPLAGASKELIVAAGVIASAMAVLHRRSTGAASRVDVPTIVLVGLFLGLYAFNLGGGVSGESGYGAPWFHGTRLVSEPWLLLLAGMALPAPRRSLRWALTSLVASAVVVAAYGVLQQRLGVAGLLELGYEYGSQVRQIGDRVRSFGTLGEPFAYATFLTFAFGALVLAFRSRPLAWAAGFVIAAGLAASYVRTAVVLLVAVIGIWLARRGHARFAALTVAAAVAFGAALFVSASGARETRLVQASPQVYLTLNGRTNIWKATLGTAPSGWALGRGVGVVGTASSRATRTLTGTAARRGGGGGGVVDSGYFSTLADVGFVGLALLLALAARLLQLARRAASGGDNAGWIALAFLTVIGLDALTRESFTGFPTAYVSLLIVGLAVGAWLHDGARSPDPAATSR